MTSATETGRMPPAYFDGELILSSSGAHVAVVRFDGLTGGAPFSPLPAAADRQEVRPRAADLRGMSIPVVPPERQWQVSCHGDVRI